MDKVLITVEALKEIEIFLSALERTKTELQKFTAKEGNGRFVHKLNGISAKLFMGINAIRSWIKIGTKGE